MSEESINWDEATASAGFVKLEPETEKVLVITNAQLVKVEKFGSEQIEFQADVISEDGEEVKEKQFTTSSKRLKQKLRPIFENKEATDKVKFSIIMIGEKFNTQYSVKEIKE